MIELRMVSRGKKTVLQMRQVPLQIGWSKGDDSPVIQPRPPVSLNSKKNWTPWEDVPFVSERETLTPEEYPCQHPGCEKMRMVGVGLLCIDHHRMAMVSKTDSPETRIIRLEDALRRAWDYARGNVTQPPKDLWEEVEALLKGVPDRRK